MDPLFSTEDEAFRAEVRDWLAEALEGTFASARGLGGPGREHEGMEVRAAWERHLGAAGWIGIGWPRAAGGRGLSLARQVVFHEEYARADAPGRLGHVGEQLLAPTLIAFGSPQQQSRFLPGIARGEELWCQGYSEPGAGSDLAAVSTRAERDGDGWVVTGQKVWTSLAHVAQWCFVLARTDPTAAKHRGLSYLLVPMDQPGITVRPITQLTGTSEFNEVFFDGARTTEMVGAPGEGWRVALGTLAFERGVATLGQQVGFERELRVVQRAAAAAGRAGDPDIQERLGEAYIGLRVLRYVALAGLADGADATAASVSKLLWASWHQRLGELALDVLGAEGTVAAGPPYDLTALQRLFLFSRADTIYGGSHEIQRNIVAERMLGLPRA